MGHSNGVAGTRLPVLWAPPAPTSCHPVDVALAAVGFGIDCRDLVRRLDALAEPSL